MKIMQFDPLATVAAGDQIPVVDASEPDLTRRTKRVAIADLIAAAPGVKLWTWNGADASQFGAPIGFKDDLNKGPGGTPSISVGPSLQARSAGDDVLIVDVPTTPTALAGGWFFPIADLDDVPERLDIELDLDWITSNTGVTFGVMVAHVSEAGVLNGLFLRRVGSSAGVTLGRVLAGVHHGTTIPVTTGPLIPNAANLATGLDRSRAQWRRPAGEAPVRWSLEYAHRFNGRAEAATSCQVTNGAPAQWSGLAMTSIGLAIYNASAGVQATAHVRRFAVYSASERS